MGSSGSERRVRRQFSEEFKAGAVRLVFEGASTRHRSGCRGTAAPAQALEHPETRTEASEALRGLIDAIVLAPNQGEPPSRAGEDSRSGEPRLQIELKGNLAAMLGAATKSEEVTGNR
jgi:transposase-like protein